MSLPVKDDVERVLSERPGDDLFPRVKDTVSKMRSDEEGLREKLVKIILDDMLLDHALSNGLDEVGEVIEYIAQEYQIERPKFLGEHLMKDLSRIGRLKLSLDYANLLELDKDTLGLVLKAEISRLWGDTPAAMVRNQLLNKGQHVIYPPPDNGVLKKDSKHDDTDKKVPMV